MTGLYDRMQMHQTKVFVGWVVFFSLVFYVAQYHQSWALLLWRQIQAYAPALFLAGVGLALLGVRRSARLALVCVVVICFALAGGFLYMHIENVSSSNHAPVIVDTQLHNLSIQLEDGTIILDGEAENVDVMWSPK